MQVSRQYTAITVICTPSTANKGYTTHTSRHVLSVQFCVGTVWHMVRPGVSFSILKQQFDCSLCFLNPQPMDRSTTSHGAANCFVSIGQSQHEDLNRSPSSICHRSLDMWVGHKCALFPVAILLGFGNIWKPFFCGFPL